MKWIIILLAVANFGCARRDEVETKTDIERLSNKFEVYADLRGGLDQFVDGGGCDSLLFTGLLGSLRGSEPLLEQYRKEAGVWLRRSVDQPDCYPEESNSRISRDMLLGLIRWMWRKGRLDLVEELLAYLEANDYVAGPGEISRTIVTPPLLGTMMWIQSDLGGFDDERKDDILAIPVYTGNEKDYQMHLAAIHMDMRAELEGGMREAHFQILSKYHNRVPFNPLFTALVAKWSDGDQDEACKQLLDHSVWPADKAPTSKNYCAPWPIQRENRRDWEPCPEEDEVHDTAPWLFVAGLILAK